MACFLSILYSTLFSLLCSGPTSQAYNRNHGAHWIKAHIVHLIPTRYRFAKIGCRHYSVSKQLCFRKPAKTEYISDIVHMLYEMM